MGLRAVAVLKTFQIDASSSKLKVPRRGSKIFPYHFERCRVRANILCHLINRYRFGLLVPSLGSPSDFIPQRRRGGSQHPRVNIELLANGDYLDQILMFQIFEHDHPDTLWQTATQVLFRRLFHCQSEKSPKIFGGRGSVDLDRPNFNPILVCYCFGFSRFRLHVHNFFTSPRSKSVAVANSHFFFFHL